MIFESLEKLGKYSEIPQVKRIIKFLTSKNLKKLPSGDIKINGKSLFVKVLRYVPEKPKDNSFETHKAYIDVQVMINGAERMFFAGRQKTKAINKYDIDSDAQLFTVNRDFSDILVNANQFVVFFPGEMHKPGCFCKSSGPQVLKLVFKVKVRR